MKARMNIRSILIIVAMICFASMFFINISFAVDTGKVTTETARLREQPQTDAKVLELASLGDEVEILEEVDGWYKVKYKNITGYIRKDLIKLENKEETNTNTNTETENAETENTTIETNATESPKETTIEKGKYSLLQSTKLKIIPLISSIELYEVNKGEEVEVIEVLNDWAKIKTTGGKEGWTVWKKTSTTGEKIELLGSLKTTNDTTTENKTENNVQTSANAQIENTTKIMYVNSQTINLRQKADKKSQIIKQLTINMQVTVLSSENGWAYVDVNGTKGYIAENLLSSTKQETSRSAMTERNTEQTTTTQTTESTKQTETTKDANSRKDIKRSTSKKCNFINR